MDYRRNETKYTFDWVKHELNIIVMHKENGKDVKLLVDGKVAFEHPVAAEETLRDSFYIKEAVREYNQSIPAKYRDIFENHADKLVLISKDINATISENGKDAAFLLHITKGVYEYTISMDGSDEAIRFRINADSFPEAFEKIRMGVRILNLMSENGTQHITELSSDDVLERFSF